MGYWRREEMLKKKIGVVLGGRSAEREISLLSGQAILAALREKGYLACPIEADELLAQRLHEEKIEIAFIGLHGRLGEDGAVQGLLEIMRIPYTGSGVLASALAMNKVISRQIFKQHSLPVPNYLVLHQAELRDLAKPPWPFSWPVVVKPCQEGSSVGVSIVSDPQALPEALGKAFSYDAEIIVEEYIKGREISVGILDNQALGAIEIVPKVEFYSYEAKYTEGLTQHIFPAPLAKADYERVLSIGLNAHLSLGCEGATRVDLLLRPEGEPVLLEVNSLPGMTPLSLLPEIARGVGINFPDLVERILLGARLKIPVKSWKGLP
ncbi:MAG: D-alanine--D-alanine ligase [Thermodesulfobacteriota bacterium]